jgi:DNA-binding NarL/FixJ family response regulator
VAEDAVLFREGMVALLARFGHEVVAALDDATMLTTAVAEHDPDLVIVDVRLPPTYNAEGLHAAVALRGDRPGLPVLVLSQYVATPYVAELLESTGDGGIGYLLKDRILDVSEFVDGVEQVAAGSCIVDPEVIRQLLGRRRDPLGRLTRREREVLALMAEGRSNAAISRALTVGNKAVSKHINAIFTKLDLPPSSSDDHRRVRAVLAYLQGDLAH